MEISLSSSHWCAMEINKQCPAALLYLVSVISVLFFFLCSNSMSIIPNLASMASEAPVTDQTVNEHMGTDVSDNLNNADEALLSKIEDLNGKDEEEISKGKDEEKVDVKKDPTSVEAPTAEPEEKLEQEEVAIVIEEVEEEAKDESVLEPSVEAEEKELKDKSDALVTPELLNEPVAQPTEILEPSIAEEPVQTLKENAHSETVTEESTSAEESSEVSAAVSPPLPTYDKPLESPPVCIIQEPAPDATVVLNAAETAADRETAFDGVEVSPESSKQLPPIETVELESSDAFTVVSSVSELIESTERTDDDHSADLDTKKSAGEELVPEVEVAECIAEPVVDVKQEQENTMDVEAVALSETNQSIKVSEDVKVIGETKNETLEGEDLSLDAMKSAEELVPAVQVAEHTAQPAVDVKLEQENTMDVEETALGKTNQTVKVSEDAKVIGETKNENLEGEEDLSLDAKKSAEVELVPEVEVAECTAESVVDVKQEQENTLDVDETDLSKTDQTVKVSEDAKVISETKNENLEGEEDLSLDAKKSAEVELVPEVEVAECTAESVVDVKQEQENTLDVDETDLSKTDQTVKVSEDAKVISETKNENLEGEEDLSLDAKKSAEVELVPEVEVAERTAEPVVDVKQEQVNTTDVEETALSKTNQTAKVSEDAKVISETKNENLEGEDVSLVDAKRSAGEELVSEVEVAETITQPVVDVKQEQENTKDVEATVLNETNQTVNASEDFEVISETKNENLEGEDLSSDAKKSEEPVPEGEVAERTEGPVVGVKQQDQEKTMDVEATVLSEPNLTVNAAEDVKMINEMKNENLEGEDLRLAEASRDIDFAGVENKASVKNQACDPKDPETEAKPAVKQTLLDKFVEESTEDKEKESVKVYDQSLAASTKDDDGATKTDGAPKSETPAKKSQRNIISKVKQSIVKVKKAIIGRSPSSKTMAAAEGIEDTKQK
ncbi:hypothetical protein OPV22_013770 [Ensete ventricosum]|uniref:Uncharacterized protein n=1 Tax=Ensete ventricosum TaxID=4639 RepID=A0AAV8PNV3_ENSVE|nr:hypothetical protein OPV22_013770 [Ensete ventricosum]